MSAVAALCLVILGAWMFRDTLAGPRLAAYLERTLTDALDMKTSVGAVTGSYLGGIDIAYLRLEATAADAPLKRLTTGPVHVRYSLGKLLLGTAAFVRQTTVTVAEARVALSLGSDASPPASPSEPLAALMILKDLPPLPSIRLTGATVSVSGAGGSGTVGPAGIRFYDDAGGTRRLGVDITGGNWMTDTDTVIIPPIAFDLTATARALRLKPVTVGDGLITADAQIDLDRIPEAIPFTVTGALAGAPVTVAGAYGSTRFAVDLNAKGIDLGAVLLKSGLRLPQTVSGFLNIDGKFDIPVHDPQHMAATLKLSITDGSYGGARISGVTAVIRSDAESLFVDRAEVTAPGNRLILTGLRLPLAPLLDADPDALAATAEGRFELVGTQAAVLLQPASVSIVDMADLPAHDYRLSGALSSGTLTIEEGRLVAGGGALKVLPSVVTLPRPLEETGTTGFEIRATVDFPDLLPVSQILSLPMTLSGRMRGKLAVTGTLKSPEGLLSLTAGALRLDDRDMGALSASVSAAAGMLSIQTLNWKNGNDRILAKGDVHIGERRANAVTVSFSITDPLHYVPHNFSGQVPAALTRLDLKGTASGTIGIDGLLPAPRIALDARLHNLRAGNQSLGEFAVKGRIEGRRIIIGRALLVNGKDRMRLAGAVDADQDQLEAVSAEIMLDDVAPYLALITEAPAALQGDLRATLSASGKWQTPDAHLSAVSEHLDTAAGPLRSLTIVAAATPDRRLQITELRAMMADTLLAAAGTLQWPAAMDALTLRLTALSAERNGTDLRLKTPSVLIIDTGGRSSLTPLTLIGSAGTITLAGRLDPAGAVAVQAHVSDLNGKGWLPDLTGGRLDVDALNATLTVSGTWRAPRIALAASTDAVRSPFLPVPLAGRMALDYADARLSISQFDWSYTDGSRIHITGDIPFQAQWKDIRPEALVTLSAEIELPQAGVLNAFLGKNRISAGSLSVAATITGTWENPEGNARLDGADVMLENGSLPLPPGPLAFSAKARYGERTIVLEHFRLNAPAVIIAGQGSWKNLPPPWLAPLAADGGAVSMDATVSATRLDWAAAGIPGVRATDGQLLANVHLRGSLSQPEITATLSVKDGQIRAEARLPAIEAINLQADITAGDLTISELSAQIGAAPLTATGRVTDVMGPDPVMDLRLNGNNLLLYRDPGLRVRGNTALVLTGPVSRLQLTGDVVITDGLFSRRIDLLGSLKASDRPESGDRGLRLFSIRQPPLRDMRLDVGISAASPFVIRSNLVRGEVKPSLRLTGTAEVPLLVGKVLVSTAKLRLPAGRMLIENGLIQFPNADPERPVIDLLGTSKLFGYDVRLIAEGPYDEPVITLSATPPLASEDILLMLLTGAPPSKDITAGDIRRRSLNVSMFIGQDLISRWFDSGDSDSGESIMERFDVQLGREITQKGEETVEAQFRLADNVFRQGDTIYLTGEKDAYDYYNAGVQFVFRLR